MQKHSSVSQQIADNSISCPRGVRIHRRLFNHNAFSNAGYAINDNLAYPQTNFGRRRSYEFEHIDVRIYGNMLLHRAHGSAHQSIIDAM